MPESFEVKVTTSPPPDNPVLPFPPARLVAAGELVRLVSKPVRIDKIGLFMVSLILFVLAIVLMKEGAHGLAPLARRWLTIDNPANSLGFGWLFAYLIMSGSPVAAAALTFFDAGVVDQLGAFTMIIGSRLGASFIVLFIGFIYVLRGRDRTTSLGMGLLSLSVTGSTYFLALFLGALMLRSGVLAGWQPRVGLLLGSLIDLVFDPLARLLLTYLPRWTLFPLGLFVILGSFNLFDRCLPQMMVKESQVGQVSRVVYRRWVMFGLGAAVTLISMSVSLSLSILVPLSNRGFIRRENVIPYIMGANITTFIDTLLAAALLKTPAAFSVILVGMISITLVSALIMGLVYRQYERAMLELVAWVTANDRNLTVFMMIILIGPLGLILL